ncbi:hypothetical protein [Candidatus Poriferisodalis sp.]|uniref:hypothetical protein n=1 Tax=Candidatus Poriferisodalis sp. TaxID=3101277 RepID=UPI003D117173
MSLTQASETSERMVAEGGSAGLSDSPRTAETEQSKIVRRLKSASDVYDIVEFIRSTARIEDETWLTLDFRELCKTSPERIDSHWAEILSNELLGEFATTRLSIRPPSQPRGRKAFDRSGLSFAIKQRAADTTDIHHGSEESAWPAEDWAGYWSPTDTNFSRRMFPHALDPDVLKDREFLTFLNPHLHANEQDLDTELTDHQARAWIEGLVSHHTRSEAVTEGGTSADHSADALITAIHDITYELVSNLQHAFEALETTCKSIPFARKRSYVQFYATRGGTRSSNRLHFVVADMGHGIVRTLLPKLRANSAYTHTSARDIIYRLVSAELPSFGQAAGQGYERVVDVVDTFGGELWLTSGSLDENGHLEVLRARRSAKRSVKPTVVDVQYDSQLEFMGTTVHVVIPL